MEVETKQKLTVKQKAWAKAYVTNNNAAESARIAKYSEATAREIGYGNTTKPHLMAYVEELRQAKGDTQQADIDRAQAVLWAIADDKTATNSAKTQAVTELARQSGWHSERLIIEEQQPRINYINSKQLITNMQVNIAIAEPVEDLRLLGGG